MKYLKAVRTELTPFTLALALCLCGVHRFADTAIATLQVRWWLTRRVKQRQGHCGLIFAVYLVDTMFSIS